MANFAKSLLRFGSANTSDALRALGRHFQAMEAGIRPVFDGARACGPAFTVRCFPGATWAIERALDLASPGDVLVVDGGGHADVILMGGLMSERAKARGLAGAVLDAAVRDVDHIAAIRFPVFARHICPRAGTFAEIGEWQVTVCCGRIPVTSGDWIVADSSGITVVPRDLLAPAIEQASRIRKFEGRMQTHLRAGKSLSESAAASNGKR